MKMKESNGWMIQKQAVICMLSTNRCNSYLEHIHTGSEVRKMLSPANGNIKESCSSNICIFRG